MHVCIPAETGLGIEATEAEVAYDVFLRDYTRIKCLSRIMSCCHLSF